MIFQKYEHLRTNYSSRVCRFMRLICHREALHYKSWLLPIFNSLQDKRILPELSFIKLFNRLTTKGVMNDVVMEWGQLGSKNEKYHKDWSFHRFNVFKVLIPKFLLKYAKIFFVYEWNDISCENFFPYILDWLFMRLLKSKFGIWIIFFSLV